MTEDSFLIDRWIDRGTDTLRIYVLFNSTCVAVISGRYMADNERLFALVICFREEFYFTDFCVVSTLI